MSLSALLRRAAVDRLHRVKRRLLRSAPALDRVGLRHLRVVEVAQACELDGRGVRDVRVLIPGGPVTFATAEDEAFLRVAKHYATGTFDRPDVFVCEVPDGLVHAGTGIVLTAEGTVVEESVLKYRLPFTTVYEGLRPLRTVHVPGVVATILNVFGDNLWHWLVDSIPRLVSLRRALPAGEPVTLVVPDHLHPAERDVLQALLPPNFSLKVVSKRTWVRGDRVILASFLTGRSNGFLPADWLGDIRAGVFDAFGLRENGKPRERIWVSRSGDRHRRVRNEDAVMAALAPLGFRSVHLAGMRAKEQVETFRSAGIVAGPYGAGLAWLLFSARIPVVVLYPDRAPNTHFVTQTSCLGQRHFFLTHDAPDEYTDFDADVPALLAQVERAALA